MRPRHQYDRPVFVRFCCLQQTVQYTAFGVWRLASRTFCDRLRIVWGAFAFSRKAHVSTYQWASHWKDFRKILYWGLFFFCIKHTKKLKIWLKLSKNVVLFLPGAISSNFLCSDKYFYVVDSDTQLNNTRIALLRLHCNRGYANGRTMLRF